MTTTTEPYSSPSPAPGPSPGPSPGLDVAALQDVLQQLANAIKNERINSERLFLQSEALASLLAFIRPAAPFPPTRGWAASPDFLMLETETIIEVARRDGLEGLRVAEASSGVSTLTAAYTLKRLGADPASAGVTSFEHDAEYATKTRRLLELHDLVDFATVIHAPLVDQELEGEVFPWYDPRSIAELEPISVLVVDGPPGRLGPIARFPALPRFLDRLRPGAIVIADDTARQGETEMLRRWSAAHPEATCEVIDTEKGAGRLRFPL